MLADGLQFCVKQTRDPPWLNLWRGWTLKVSIPSVSNNYPWTGARRLARKVAGAQKLVQKAANFQSHARNTAQKNYENPGRSDCLSLLLCLRDLRHSKGRPYKIRETSPSVCFFHFLGATYKARAGTQKLKCIYTRGPEVFNVWKLQQSETLARICTPIWQDIARYRKHALFLFCPPSAPM